MGSIALPGWLREIRIGGDGALALGGALLLAVLVVPLPVLLLDAALALSITLSVLILMVALFLTRPLDFTAFPQILLLSTLLRLALNVATTRTILTHGHEGPQSAGQVVAAFGGLPDGRRRDGRPDRLRDPAGGELHGGHQGLRPHRRGGGAVQPGRH